MRRIEDAFRESGERAREPSADAVRAAEALLFAGGEPLTAKALAEKLGPGVDIAAVLMKLKGDYAGRGVQLIEAGGAWRFQSAPDLAGLFAETRAIPRKLPKAAMETLAVIAYHQPVTRAEIEEIRGVSLSRGSMELLLEIGWIRPRGRRRTPGRPLTFGTTDAFLGQFGLPSLEALPGKDDLKALGLLDPRAAAALEIPRPGAEPASDEEPLEIGDDNPEFFRDHLDEHGE
ncbi:MAG: SMC-Scp complex subunit ScpB [Proteobacteria bacterium]|nr:SMC-Scp complex subunit ScpB [Pseudomonadota bacterium]